MVSVAQPTTVRMLTNKTEKDCLRMRIVILQSDRFVEGGIVFDVTRGEPRFGADPCPLGFVRVRFSFKLSYLASIDGNSLDVSH